MGTFNFIEETGTVVPDVSDLLETVENEFKSIFGEDFVVDPETPEGTWIASEVQTRASIASNNAQVANQINPNLSDGVFLDAIWALTGGARIQQSRSTVVADLTGTPGLFVASGATARTTDNQLFRSTISINLDNNGMGSVAFESVEFGPIAAASGTLTNIVSSVLGWDTITNPLAATPGRNLESGSQSRRRRRDTIGRQGRQLAAAVIGNLRAIPEVRSVAFRENFLSTTEVIDGITLVANSIWVAVQGGSDEEIADAIVEAKGGGANFNGDVSVPYTNPESGQTYNVLFDRPEGVAILVRATIRSGATQPTDPVISVRAAILAYANGDQEDETGFVVGEDVSPFELAGAVQRRNPEFFLINMEISLDTDPSNFANTAIPISIGQIATIDENDITVVVQ